MEKTTDDTIIRLKYRVFIPVVIAIVVATNTVTSLILNIGDTASQVTYDKERSDRKDKSTLEDSKTYTDIQFYKLEIKELKQELKDCKDAR